MPKHLYSTLSEAVEALRRRGFTADFTCCRETGTMTAEGRSYKGEELRIVDHYRFEGCPIPMIPRCSMHWRERMGPRGSWSMRMACTRTPTLALP